MQYIRSVLCGSNCNAKWNCCAQDQEDKLSVPLQSMEEGVKKTTSTVDTLRDRLLGGAGISCTVLSMVSTLLIIPAYKYGDESWGLSLDRCALGFGTAAILILALRNYYQNRRPMMQQPIVQIQEPALE